MSKLHKFGFPEQWEWGREAKIICITYFPYTTFPLNKYVKYVMVTLHGCCDAISHLWLCLQQRHEPQPHNLSEGSGRLALGHSLWFLDPQLSAAVNSQRQACHFIFPFHSSTSAFPADWRTKALLVHARIQWSLFLLWVCDFQSRSKMPVFTAFYTQAFSRDLYDCIQHFFSSKISNISSSSG